MTSGRNEGSAKVIDRAIRRSNSRKILYDIGLVLDRYGVPSSGVKTSGGEDYTYREVYIRDGGKRKLRRILIPSFDLKTIQRRLLDEFLYEVRPHSAAYAFQAGRSILENAKQHHKCKYMFKTDISNFFYSISDQSIRRCLNARIPNLLPESLSNIIDMITLDGALPQGAPTSPHISNLIMTEFDEVIDRKARDNSAVYTRYADDITVSSDSDIVVEGMSSYVSSQLRKFGFSQNHGKTKIYCIKDRKIVTGLDVSSDLIRPKKSFRKKTENLNRIFCSYQRYKLAPIVSGRILFWRSIAPKDQDLIDISRRFWLASLRYGIDQPLKFWECDPA